MVAEDGARATVWTSVIVGGGPKGVVGVVEVGGVGEPVENEVGAVDGAAVGAGPGKARKLRSLA
jgi:hypothetical protein